MYLLKYYNKFAEKYLQSFFDIIYLSLLLLILINLLHLYLLFLFYYIFKTNYMIIFLKF